MSDENYYYEDEEDDFYLQNPKNYSKTEKSDPLKKFKNKVKFEKYVFEDELNVNFQDSVTNKVLIKQKENDKRKIRHKSKEDRATTEQVLDPRTRKILYKLMNKGVVTSIHGCLSTGKEANVYYAERNEKSLAIKIYKTSILVFKDRDRYVTGEFRWRSGYAKHNPRKMVSLWAEKEKRNLHRLNDAKIPSPIPYEVKSNVLVMDFIGKQSYPAPRLKDIKLKPRRYRKLYWQMIKIIRKMFVEAKLVHADLSEYNLLYMDKTIYVIDVSQSVERDHPNAFVFLRKDCFNINNFFNKKGVKTLTTKELFDFVISKSITEENEREFVKNLQKITKKRDKLTNEQLIQDEAFKEVYIPMRLDEVVDIERDLDDMKYGETENIHYQTVFGLDINSKEEGILKNIKKKINKKNKNKIQENEENEGNEEKEGNEEEEENEEEEGNEEQQGNEEEEENGGEEEKEQELEEKQYIRRKIVGSKEEIRNEKRRHKQQVKLQKKEKRKNKIKKGVKKRKQRVIQRKKKGHK
ncbi:serine/threonine-protein kinase rio1 [Anaeramoeba flamelloides]|uniref:Serine/threonine-protein kinase RIO1 n=1 Tax=Anaeramoeba flamelloides TaxID=1746091 RepID=A0AAV7YTU7_9EUKA|nr:serine/threonine-protein kinase rio1 [Anaeramoeba flamelloides]